MKKYFIKCVALFLLLWMLISCSEDVKIIKHYDEVPKITPDYIDVTIPPNIAPLNFKLDEVVVDAMLKIYSENDSLTTFYSRGQFFIAPKKWGELLNDSRGKKIDLHVSVKEKDEWASYKSFSMQIASDSIDPYLAYRLIEPGYEVWNEMGIYQRNLETYEENPILENHQTGNGCMNCHSFRQQDPSNMMLHTRGAYPSTIIVKGDTIEKLNTKTQETISPLVYPSWHPSGNFIAFSVNNTFQDFHTSDRKRVEVYDSASDVVVYDVRNHELISIPNLMSDTEFESFPTFSPDGQTLYFSTSPAQEMPVEYKKVKYSICSITFNTQTREFGNEVDTIFNAKLENMSASFPRISPNGKYLLFTKGDYGGFFIWHKEAELCIADLESKNHYSLDKANSNDAESYHSWGSNSKWIVFSSRRIDGLYTRPFIAHIDENGQAHKAFVVPQQNVEYYSKLMKSFNVPELIKGKVQVSSYKLSQKIKNDSGIDLRFRKMSDN